jgi:HlyD family secretion protein
MSRRVLGLTVLLGGAGILALGMLFFAPEPIPVRAVPVERGRVERTVSNTKAGTVKARQRARMTPEAAGRVVEILYREGDRVAAGAPILRLNDATQSAQVTLSVESLRAMQASQREACLARDRARRELGRQRKLAERKVLSADALDQYETKYLTADASCSAFGARVAESRAQVALAGAALEKLVLRAPFAGVIAELDAEVGEWVTPSPPLLVAPAAVDLIDPNSLYVSAPMDEVDSAAIRAGQRARVTVDSHPGRELGAAVARVAPYVLDVEAQNRTVEIEVELDDPGLSAQLLPGTSADVEVILEVNEDALRVPAPALLEGDRVLLVRDGRLEEQSIEVGLKNWDWAEVRDGLAADALVVVSLERADVRAGARVEVEETSHRP